MQIEAGENCQDGTIDIPQGSIAIIDIWLVLLDMAIGGCLTGNEANALHCSRCEPEHHWDCI
jgi:hypothetical protein